LRRSKSHKFTEGMCRRANMLLIGIDYHPSFQTIAFFMEETGEYGEQELNHSDGQAEKFYRDLQQRGICVRVGKEATGYSRWFERLLAELGCVPQLNPETTESLLDRTKILTLAPGKPARMLPALLRLLCVMGGGALGAAAGFYVGGAKRAVVGHLLFYWTIIFTNTVRIAAGIRSAFWRGLTVMNGFAVATTAGFL
jgi:hypothetical protein